MRTSSSPYALITGRNQTWAQAMAELRKPRPKRQQWSLLRCRKYADMIRRAVYGSTLWDDTEDIIATAIGVTPAVFKSALAGSIAVSQQDYLRIIETAERWPRREAPKRATKKPSAPRAPRKPLIPTTALGRNLRARRLSLELSYRDLDQRADVCGNMIKQIETGRRQPGLDTLRKLAKALETTPAALLEGDV
jgi:DNA-binding XRE family transcriptional regulator